MRWVWGCAGRHRGSGVLYIQWGHLSNTRPGNFFLHVEYPRPPPPRGAAAVLVLDGKCGNGFWTGSAAEVQYQYLGAFVSSFKAPWPTQIATESPLNVENDGACPRCEI